MSTYLKSMQETPCEIKYDMNKLNKLSLCSRNHLCVYDSSCNLREQKPMEFLAIVLVTGFLLCISHVRHQIRPNSSFFISNTNPFSNRPLLGPRMVGYDSPKFDKPHRSEELASPEEQAEQARKVRAYLAATAPTRILKPSRSDAAEDNVPAPLPSSHHDPPERVKFLQLLADGVPLETRGSGDVEEDYTESEYYQYMAAIDKEHHTTGTGFIKVDKAAAPQGGFRVTMKTMQPARSFRSNPAMNDWEPADDDASISMVKGASNKPLRSESSSDELASE